MKIVVLDGHTLNPGDLSWDGLARLGTLDVYDRTPPELTVSRLTDAVVAITNKVRLTAAVMSSLPHLRYIGVAATGYDVVDVAAAAERGIVVTNVPAYGTPSVVEMVFALLLELTRSTRVHSDMARSGAWSASPDFCFWRSPQIELAGKTMGLVGFGRIGQHVARVAGAFGMRVLATDPVQNHPPGFADFTWTSLETLLRDADVVSLHCPLTPATRGLISRAALELMKPTAFLINTARGPLIDEPALADALNAGRLAGAGLDVLAQEPPPSDHPLLRARNCLITPHIAWATFEARARLLKVLVENVRAFLEGRPVNAVSH